MVSLLVLSLFLAVGFLDSLHFRAALPQTNGGEKMYSPEVLSVFDKLVDPLRTHNEKTYSEPFALTLYAKESTTDAHGNVVREYPRLRYGGAHLADVAQRGADVLQRSLLGGLAGLFVGAVLVLLHQALDRAARGVHCHSHRCTCHRRNCQSRYGVSRLGTDKVGQDVLYLSLKSIRTGLVIGTVTTLVTLPLALFLGVAAGYFRGWVDDVIQYIYTVLNSIPSVLLIAAAVLMMQVTIDTHPQWFETGSVTRRPALGVPVPDPRCDQLDRTVPPVARRDTEAARNGIYPGGAIVRRVFDTHPHAPHHAQCDAYRADFAGDGLFRAGTGRSGAVIRWRGRRSQP